MRERDLQSSITLLRITLEDLLDMDQEDTNPSLTLQQGFAGLFGVEFVFLQVAEDCTSALTHSLSYVHIPCMD